MAEKITTKSVQLSVEDRRALYAKLVERFPGEPIEEFGESIPDPRDTYDQLELAQSLLELQAMAEFLLIDVTYVGNGIGFVVMSFPGGETKFRKAIFESADDARRFIAEIRDADHARKEHWFMGQHDYMPIHRQNKRANPK